MIENNKNFVHLHVHSFYSLLDGCSSPQELAQRAKELGMKSLALTDHNHLLGVVDFQNACKEEEIKPLIGVELYYTKDTKILSAPLEVRKELADNIAFSQGISYDDCKTQKEITALREPFMYDKTSHHILFIAKSRKGYLNLVKLQSEAARICTTMVFGQPRFNCDDELINLYKEDLIMTSACIGSYPSHLIEDGRLKEAEEVILNWSKMFGEDFYLEIQPLSLPLQYKVNQFYIEMNKKYGIKLVATNDVHYTLKEDNNDHDTILCVGTAKLKSDPERMRYAHEFWMRSRDEMEEAFVNQYNACCDIPGASSYNDYLSHCMSALDNTLEIADKVNDTYLLGSEISLLPQAKIDTVLPFEDYLTLICYENLFAYKKRKPSIDLDIYMERLDYELSVINNKGFASYMLINWENVKWCEKMGIPTGPGRGSAAGSLVLFLLNVTKNIDPIASGLSFFRFLTEDRTALPDIDQDFSYKRRGEVITHLQDTYGIENVAHIGTITCLGVKSGLKDFARVLGMTPAESDGISKQLDVITEKEPGIKFKDLDKLKESDLENDLNRYKAFSELEARYKEIFRLARRFEGMPRNLGVHASGVLVMPMPVSDIFPVKYVDDTQVCLFEGNTLEKFSALKLDVLGLRTLDVINDYAVSKNPDMNIYDVYNLISDKLENEDYFNDICDLKTEAIFQIESNLFKGIIKDMQPRNIEDITALVAIARPGPLAAGMHTMYNNRKNGLEEWDEPLPFTMEFVESTYGCIIYQEQIMQIAQKVAKFNGNQTDSMFRKAVAKKLPELFEICRRCFIWGKINEEPSEDYDTENPNQAFYDPKGKYGPPILGGIHNTENGDCYTEEMLMDFLENLKKFSHYLFNKSHAACYALLACITAYCCNIDRASYFAQVLDMDSQNGGEKLNTYLNVCNKNGIRVFPPDINHSNMSFTEYNGNIYFGISGIQSVGKAASIIIENRPYNSVADLLDRTTKKTVNKTVVENLIKAGAFDSINVNRHQLLNEAHEIRKDKKEPILKPDDYDKQACRDFELSTLKLILTYPSIWTSIPYGSDDIEALCVINKLEVRNDKRDNPMGFLTLDIDGETVKGLIFSRDFKKVRNELQEKKTVYLSGRVDDKGTFIINKFGSGQNSINQATAPRLAYDFSKSFI